MTESLVMCFPRVSFLVDEQVKTGQLAYFLIRPHSYILYLLATYLGEALVRLTVNLVVAGTMAWVLVGPPPLREVLLIVYGPARLFVGHGATAVEVSGLLGLVRSLAFFIGNAETTASQVFQAFVTTRL